MTTAPESIWSHLREGIPVVDLDFGADLLKAFLELPDGVKQWNAWCAAMFDANMLNPAWEEGDPEGFLPVRCEFAEANQRICLPHLPHKAPDVWRTAPHMFNGIANIKSRVNYIIPRGSPLAARLPFRPLLPPSKLVKKLKELIGLKFLRSGGNHDIYRTPNGKNISIPRHQRDLGRGLLRKILREVGLDIGLEGFLQQ